MVPELIIFDCDGVLVDTEPIANRVLAEMLTAEGYPIDAGTCVARFLGHPPSETFREVERELRRPLSPGFAQRYQRRVIDSFLAAPRRVSGIAGAIAGLPGRRCVASSSEPSYLREVLGASGLWELFERIFSAREVARGKPAPDLFLHAAATLGVRPERCLVVEDSPAGVSAAVAAGMPVLGYVALVDAGELAARGAVPFTAMAQLAACITALSPHGRPTRSPGG